MTASLPERPPGRVHWPYGKTVGATIDRAPAGLPPRAPPEEPQGKAFNRDSINFRMNTT